jgi:TonB family protein
MFDQLDQRIEAVLDGAVCDARPTDSDVTKLMAVADELRCLPDPEFKERLKSDLALAVRARSAEKPFITEDTEVTGKPGTISSISPGRQNEDSADLSHLFAPPTSSYPVRRASFIASLAAHAAAVALVVTVGIWAAPDHQKPLVRSFLVTDVTYALPPAATETHGGGGGGDRDILQASKGVPPRFSNEQLSPPAIVVRNEQPKLPTEATVVGPPNLSFPQVSRLGDPLAAIISPPSNGIGSGGGIGAGSGGGVGPGRGPGVGDGWGGGIGHGPYRIGGGVTAPHAIYDPEPEYSEEARRVKYQGIAVLQVVIDAEGRPRDVRIARSAGMGLDEKAIEAVRKWRFEPGTLNGKPVAVIVNVEVNFRLY